MTTSYTTISRTLRDDAARAALIPDEWERREAIEAARIKAGDAFHRLRMAECRERQSGASA